MAAAGFGRLELAVIAEEIGRALAPIPFSSSAYLASEAILLLGSEAQRRTYLPKLASGEWIGTFAHAEQAGAPGAGRHPHRAQPTARSAATRCRCRTATSRTSRWSRRRAARPSGWRWST